MGHNKIILLTLVVVKKVFRIVLIQIPFDSCIEVLKFSFCIFNKVLTVQNHWQGYKYSWTQWKQLPVGLEQSEMATWTSAEHWQRFCELHWQIPLCHCIYLPKICRRWWQLGSCWKMKNVYNLHSKRRSNFLYTISILRNCRFNDFLMIHNVDKRENALNFEKKKLARKKRT